MQAIKHLLMYIISSAESSRISYRILDVNSGLFKYSWSIHGVSVHFSDISKRYLQRLRRLKAHPVYFLYLQKHNVLLILRVYTSRPFTDSNGVLIIIIIIKHSSIQTALHCEGGSLLIHHQYAWIHLDDATAAIVCQNAHHKPA